MPNDTKETDGTRRRLMDAARDLFADRGYHGASVRDICRVAEANGAAVSYHFGGKADLYRAVAIAVSQEVAATWPKAGARISDYPTPDAALDHVVESLTAPHTTDRSRVSMVQIGNWEMAAPTDLIDDIIRQWLEPVFGLIRELLRTYSSEPMDPVSESLAVLAVLELAATGTRGQRIWPWFGHDEPLDGAKMRRRLRDLLRRFIKEAAPGIDSADPMAPPAT